MRPVEAFEWLESTILELEIIGQIIRKLQPRA